MHNYKNLLLVLSCICFLIACRGGGESSESQADSLHLEEAYQEFKQNKTQVRKEAVQKRQERIEKGDTLAIKSKTLRDFLPKTYQGYEPTGDFVGTPYGMSGDSYSNAEQSYQKENSHLRITLDDYNGKKSQHAQSITLWTTASGVDNQYIRAGGFLLYENMPGWEIYDKRHRRAELRVAVSDRFLLTIIADNQENIQFVKSLARSMRLKELAQY